MGKTGDTLEHEADLASQCELLFDLSEPESIIGLLRNEAEQRLSRLEGYKDELDSQRQWRNLVTVLREAQKALDALNAPQARQDTQSAPTQQDNA